MRFGKMLILLVTVVLFFLFADVGYYEYTHEPKLVHIPVSAAAELDGRQEKIACWQDAAGDYMIFLPSGANMSDVVLTPEEGIELALDQRPLEAGMHCGDFELDTPYLLSCTENGIAEEHTLTFLQSARLPSLHVDVQSGNMDLIHAVKGNQESGTLRLYSQEGKLEWSEQIESLRGRGNTTWTREKKPYSMTLAREADLLGMGKAKEWVLLANALDPSHLRNKAAYDLAAQAGMPYTPECQWVDLYLNGEYAGLYLLSERNEIHPQRVDLQEAGSFLVSRESWWRVVKQNQPHIMLDSGTALRIRNSGLTEEALYRLWQPIENAILAEDGLDPQSGKSWLDFIDLDSWVMDYLTGEIFANVDGGIVSAFFYKDGSDPSGKVYAGPVWDYDWSMGNKNAWQAETVRAFFVNRRHVWKLNDTTWHHWLNRKPEFRSRLKELYKEVYRPLVQELLETGLDTYGEQIAQAASLDQRRWGTENAREETEWIRQYLTERLDFLDSVWLEGQEYCKVLVLINDYTSASVCHVVFPGETLPSLPWYEEDWAILGWYDAETDQPFDVSKPIYKNMVVYLKRLPGEEDTISPLQAVPIVVLAGGLMCLFLFDKKRRRTKKAKAEKPIAKQEIV